jgi:hypothetical protein
MNVTALAECVQVNCGYNILAQKSEIGRLRWRPFYFKPRVQCRLLMLWTTTPSSSNSLKPIPKRPSNSPKTVGREIAFRFLRIVDRTFTQAVRNTDRADQGTCSAGSEGHARDRGASQDGRYQGIRPAHLSGPAPNFSVLRSPGCPPGFLLKAARKWRSRESA